MHNKLQQFVRLLSGWLKSHAKLFFAYAIFSVVKLRQLCLRESGDNSFIVINYHRVLPARSDYFRYAMVTEKNNFEQQIRFLSQHYNVYTLRDAISLITEKKNLKANAVVITFDDGYIDNYEIAFPILKKYNVPATIFLTTGPLDSGIPLWWDWLSQVIFYLWEKDKDLLFSHLPLCTHLKSESFSTSENFSNNTVDYLNSIGRSERELLLSSLRHWYEASMYPPINSPMLTWNNVVEMAAHGISFETHTVSHPFLDELSISELLLEINESRSRIAQMTGQRADIIACPRGRLLSPEQKEIIGDSFFAVCSTVPSRNDYRSSRYCINRKDANLLSLGDSFNKYYFSAELTCVTDTIKRVLF